MKRFLCMLGLSVAAFAQVTGLSFEQTMANLQCDTALIFRSNAVEVRPVWSPEGKAVAVRANGEWWVAELDKLPLKKMAWRGGLPLAVPTRLPDKGAISEATALNWAARNPEDGRQVKTKSGTIITLEEATKGVSLRVHVPGGQPRVLWKTEAEDCHSLVLSPDQKWVAFVCEWNGVVVMKVP